MTNILISWIGETDLDVPKPREQRKSNREIGSGPIGQALAALKFEKAVLIYNYQKRLTEVENYLAWLKKEFGTTIQIEPIYEELTNPTDYEKIFEICKRVILQTRKREGDSAKLTFHLSPGTSQMHTVWVILAKTLFEARLIQSSMEAGVKEANIPFDISARFIPELIRKVDESLVSLAIGKPSKEDSFASIIGQSAAIQEVKDLGKQVAISSFPVLIEGESGTGKELFATAIHNASPRKKRGKELEVVNCGAIPAELVEAELFGYAKGAFTGANKDKIGYFEAANGSSLFLDEIGELPLPAQVKLLRVLQTNEVTRLGETTPRKIDVRIISATNRNLIKEVQAGKFREDLFFRLAVVILTVPPIRAREGDIMILIDHLFDKIKAEYPELGFEHKYFSLSTKNFLLNHDWPGNVRELKNVLVRAAFFATKPEISIDDARKALSQFVLPEDNESEQILNRPLRDGFTLKKTLAEVTQHYLARAMIQTHNNKTEAAKLIGFNNYQTLSNWLEKYKLDDGT